MSKVILSLYTTLILYIYIYSPPFRVFPFNISLFFIFPSYLYILKNKQLKYLISTFKIEILLISILSSYSFLLGALAGFEFSFFLNNLFFIIQIIPVSFWFFHLFTQNSVNKSPENFKNLIYYLGIIAIIASIICILAFVFPELGIFFKFKLQKYDENLLVYQFNRGFGIADELFFSFALVQGIILIIILYTSKNILINILCFLIITFSIILNARIGLIVFVFLPFVLFRNISIVKYIFAGSFFIILIYSSNLYDTLANSISIPLKFGSSFFLEMGDTVSGSSNAEYSTINNLFGSIVIFSENWYELLFGTGQNTFINVHNATDIGYLLMLNFGGLIYISIFILFSFYLFYRLVRLNSFFPLISYLIIYVFLVANIKGLFFAPKPGMKLIMLIYVFIILTSKKIRNSNKIELLNNDESKI